MNNATINAGQSVTLTWKTSNATAVRLDGASVATSGSSTQTPSATHTYILQADGPVSTVSAAVTVTVVAPQPQASSRVQIANGPTNWISANRNLSNGSDTLGGDAWQQPGGDWFDLNGIFDGPTSSISVPVTAGQPVTVPIANVQGDLMLRGPRISWDANGHAPIFIDAAQASTFWVDVSTNRSLTNAVSFPGDPVYVLNPTRGATLTVTPATTGTMTVDRVAGPPIIDYPFVGPSNSPDIMELDMVDEATIINTIGAGNIAAPYAFNPEFGVEASGLRYLRFSSNPASDGVTPNVFCRIISWFYLFPVPKQGATTAHCRYCVYVEPDYQDGDNGEGIKWPGLSNGSDIPLPGQTETISLRMEQTVIAPNNGALSGLVTYSYSASSGGGFGTITALGPLLRAGQWYTIEQRAVMNTPGVADGEFEVWVNGNVIYHKTDVEYRLSGTNTFNMIHVNFFHGGSQAPKALMHWRVARIAASSSYIGPPSELVTGGGALPAWRSAWATPVLQWGGITGTSLSSLSGPDHDNVDAFAGYAAVDDATRAQWIGAATGGHSDTGWNGVFGLDLMADAPAWALLADASPQPAEHDVPIQPDGKPTSAHRYWHSVFSPQRNRVFNPCEAAAWGNGNSYASFNGFNLGTNTWDTAGTWPATLGPPSDFLQSWAVIDPQHGDLYMGQNTSNGFTFKWTDATNTWTQINAFPYAGSVGACFDTKRRLIVRAGHGANDPIDFAHFEFYNVDTQTQGVSPLIAGMPSTYTGRPSIAYDSRNDRYYVIDASNVYKINPVTWSVEATIATPEGSATDIFGRFAYLSLIRGLVYYVNFSGLVWFMATE